MSSELRALCNEKKVKADVVATNDTNPNFPDSYAFRVQLHYKRRQLTTPFFVGYGWTREPDAADVLGSLLSDAATVRCADSFETWCNELGYDPDSRRAYATWTQCVAGEKKLARFLGDDYQDFMEVEH